MTTPKKPDDRRDEISSPKKQDVTKPIGNAPRNQIVGGSVPGREFDDDVPPGHSPDTVPDDGGFTRPVMGTAHEASEEEPSVEKNVHPEPRRPSPTAVYKLLSADATINGQKYSTHYTDHGGHYGLFTLSEAEADLIMAQGWQIVEVGGEDDFSVHPELEQEAKDEEASRHAAPPKKVDNQGRV
jgi:hypothetical protein